MEEKRSAKIRHSIIMGTAPDKYETGMDHTSFQEVHHAGNMLFINIK